MQGAKLAHAWHVPGTGSSRSPFFLCTFTFTDKGPVPPTARQYHRRFRNHEESQAYHPDRQEPSNMRSYKGPSFQDRIGSAAEAKKKALDNLRSKPPLDEKRVAERQAARLEREAAAAAKRTARKWADQAATDSKAAEQAATAAAASALPTEAERKAARDARYAARKGRK
jgi:uncharacterized protein DUF6481